MAESSNRSDKPPATAVIGLMAFVFLWWIVIVPFYKNLRGYKDIEPVPEAVREEGGETVPETPGQPSVEEVAGREEQPAPGPEESARPESRPQEPGTVQQAPPEHVEPAQVAPDVKRETEELHVTFTSYGAAIRDLSLRHYHFTPSDESPLPLLTIIGSTPDGSVVRPLELWQYSGGRVVPWSFAWELIEKEDDFDEDGLMRITYRTTQGGLEVEKRFILEREGSSIRIEIEARNTGEEVTKADFALVGAAGMVLDCDPSMSRFVQIGATLAARDSPDDRIVTARWNAAKMRKQDMKIAKAFKEGRVEEAQGMREEMVLGRRLSREVIEWAAVKNRYFVSILAPADVTTLDAVPCRPITAFCDSIAAPEEASDPLMSQPNVLVAIKTAPVELRPGESCICAFSLLTVPVKTDVLAAYSTRDDGSDRGYGSLVSYGTWLRMDWLSQLLVIILKGFHHATRLLGARFGGYGLAIFMLTLTVKAALHAFTRKSMTSMYKMQKIQPLVQELKKKYEKDKSPEAQKKMQTETMALYREKGVNPLGGCLPMLVQLPMFIALFGALRTAFELRQAPFLWINDLSMPDRFLGIQIPTIIFGRQYVNLLPILYLVLMLVQQRLQPKSQDPQARQQQQMMMFMPFMLLFLFYSMPSGLVLYFVFSNLVMIVEQKVIRVRLEAQEALAATASDGDSKSKGGGKAAKTTWDKEDERAQKEAERRKQGKDRRMRNPLT